MVARDLKYPGDDADPKVVAKYFEGVAISYGLPGILPVMTSYVELTAAWLVPGDVKTVYGYLKPVDNWSVGYFQQQYDGNPDGIQFGWGTYDQLIDAEYALHRFCKEAVKYIDDEWHADTTDPDALGRWCQAVQRSAVPNAYRDKGYPAALELIKVEDQWPQRKVAFTTQGWMYDVVTGEFLITDPNLDIASDSSGWVYKKSIIEVSEDTVVEVEEPTVVEEVAKWSWPEAWDEPWSSGPYHKMFPTRYNWVAPVEEWARYLVDNYNVWVTTYYAHPPYWWKETLSFDVWDYAGRGNALDTTVGDKIFDLLFNYEGKPDIDWIIYKGRMWTSGGGWQSAPDGAADSDPGHWEHIHVTYKNS